MLSSFDLKKGVSEQAFVAAKEAMFRHLVAAGEVMSVGKLCRRDRDTQMDTDADRTCQYYFLTTFNNKAQSDHSYDYMLQKPEPGNTLHHAVFSKVENAVFTCFGEIEDTLT